MMNRFRKNKKAKEVKETLAELENGHSSSPFSLKLSKKKDAPEEELKLDFADALPSSDDFRTSLLMPKLSARFSMLREQDDPASMMGKASDDSVLFPKRASRLNLFGHNPAMLADIDEVSSNDGSRPSLALGRTDSYMSGDGGYGTDDDRSHNGSIMSRARRAEGNNLFGGRQKVYRIPVRSPGGESPTAESPRGMGKFVYEHDLNMSAFQRMRLQEKQDKAAEEAALEIATPDSEDTPSISSANRTTFSSTASGPGANARSSTAATSIDESQTGTSYLQPSGSTPTSESPSDTRPPSALSINRPGSVRSRRLYGQGLTQNVQSHQNSTLHRLESLSRQRSGTPDLMNRNYTRSATNLRDRLQKLAINEPTVSRPTSPPSSATSPKQLPRLETAPKDRLSPTAANFGVPPLSPPSSENEESNSLLAAALNPEDHGKATAMGLFNRPSTGFDEQQFVRRQLQLHQGRDTPPPLQPSSSPRRVMSHEQPNRPRGLSKSSFRSRAESASSHYSSDAHNGMEHSRASSVEASPRAPGVRTFYAASTNSDSGDEGDDRRSYELSSVTSMGTDYSLHHSSITPKPPTPTGEHLETLPEVRYSDLGDLKPITEDEIPEEVQPSDAMGFAPERPDSPTLQPSIMGLDGIRSHLRTGSDRSSIFPPPSPVLPIAVVEHKKLEPEVSVLEVQPSPITEDHLRVDAMPDSSEAETSSYRDSSRQSTEVPTSRGSQDSSSSGHSANVPSWQQDLAYHHRREGSTETQKEREEFAMEIAERRRKIQEKLRSVAESESRSSSPTPSQSGSEANSKYGNGFSLLKHKHNKHGNKMEMYGFNSSSTPSLLPEDQSREERPPMFSRHSNSSAPQIPTERSFRSRMPTLSRSASRESSHSRGTSPQPGFRMQRDRSSSDASGRSKSRTRYRDRDDLETVEEGAVIAHENFVIPDNFEPPAIGSVPGSARPSIDGIECLPYDRSASAASGRYRSASRSGTPSLQYERPFQFNQAPNPASIIGASPRPSPATPAYSANATPPLNEIPPSPTANPASVGNSQVPPPRASGHNMLQKRPVNKKLISEPTLVSCTSNVPTVGIPAGTTPPLPPMNPRRRRGTQTILSAFRPESRVSSPAPSITDEHSVFPDDEKRPRSRSRLRKKSLEAGERVASPAPAVPQYPPPSVPVDGGMF